MRLPACPEADPVKVAALRRVLARTDPFALFRADRLLSWSRFWKFANRVTPPAAGCRPQFPQPRGVTPWRGWVFSDRLSNGTSRHSARTALAAR